MKVYETSRIRNITLIGNKGVGKTSILDALLFCSGANTRIGSVSGGTSAVDYDPSEIKRQQTLISKVIPCEWNGYKINLIDTPGYADFIGEVLSGLWVSDFACLVVDASGGIDIQTKRLYKYATEWNKPVMFFINKCDSERADVDKMLASIRETLNPKAVLVEAPMGSGAGFNGVVAF